VDLWQSSVDTTRAYIYETVQDKEGKTITMLSPAFLIGSFGDAADQFMTSDHLIAVVGGDFLQFRRRQGVDGLIK